MGRFSIIGVAAMLVAVLTQAGVYGNGYKILAMRSVKATGMGEAFITQADDPSALAMNPAGLAYLDGTQLSLQATVCNTYIHHRRTDGSSEHNDSNWQTVPAFYSTCDFGLQDVSFGLGVSLPNGLSSDWGEDSAVRYVATYSELVLADLTAGVGFKVTDNLQLGFGLDYYHSKARLERMVDPLFVTGLAGPDLRQELTGDGDAWGFNVGGIYRFNSHHSIAFTYRHPFTVDYEGDLTIHGVLNNDMEASIDFPTVVVFGYAFQPTEKWKFELNIDYTNWEDSDFSQIDQQAPGAPDPVLLWHLEDSVAYKVGLEYRWSETFALRCGYIYNENATPDAQWRPSLPDTRTHFFTAGCSWTRDRFVIDAACQIVYYETRSIDNDVDANESNYQFLGIPSRSTVDGTYRTWAPCFSLAVTYRF